MHKQVLTALVLVAALAGCSDDGDDAGADATPTPSSASGSPSESPESPESSAPAGPAYFESRVRPAKGVAPGTILTVEATGATPSTDYYCLLAVYDTDGGGVSAPLESSLVPVTSDAEGALTCEVAHEAFEAPDTEGTVRHCPTTAADRKDGFSCGVVLADATTVGATSASAVPYVPRS